MLQSIRIFALLLVLFPAFVLAQETLISPFEGSERVGTYQARFAELPLLVTPLGDRNVPAVERLEGALVSHIYRRPEGVDTLEIYRSYRDALEEGGFEILLDCRAPDCNLKLSVPPTYQYSGVLNDRDYGRMPTGTPTYLAGWARHYLSARKSLGGRTYHAMIIISSERGLYSVDVLESAERKEDTVTLSQALLEARIEDQGRSVLEGIHFETGRAVIREDSASSLDVITSYLEAHPGGRYYVVGHTDDTGDTRANVALSMQRATAVIDALADRGVDPGRLEAEGVGPYAPVASNQTESGKSLNRRVELVQRL